MILARLPLALVALIALAACNNDATAPEAASAGPSLGTGYIGSGMAVQPPDTLIVVATQTGGTGSPE